jgi:hypothetical protein
MRPKTILLAAFLLAPLGARAQEVATPPPPDLRVPPPAAPQPGVAAAAPAPVETAAPAAKAKHGFFPIWGDKVRAKGFSLPEPFGFMTAYYWQRSDIDITNLKLGLNGGPMYDASGLVQIPSARTEAGGLSIRPNVMILPFLSLYGVFSAGATETNVAVNVLDTYEFNTLAKSGAQVVALGATFQMGYRGFFAVADFNAAVTDVERLADTVGANMLSFRLGYNFKLDAKGRGIAVWGGTAGQVLGVDTKGSVRLAEVLPGLDGSNLPDCTTAPPLRQQLCQDLVDAIQGAYSTATVDYSLEKRPAGIWNLVLGSQFALDRAWQFRVETTFLNGRTSFLGAVEYRFDIT